jgi:tetratricopeptide (TPR) repeat protein
MRVAVQMWSACLLAAAVPYTWANGGGAMPRPSMPSMPREQTPQQKAHDAYNDGVHEVKKADKAQATADQSADAGKKDKALKEAHERYDAARAKFEQASGLDPTLAEAWNYLGYTHRRLGHYDEALAAYSKALSLKPGYPDALEYRGEAFLALGRIPDAQQTYLDLYAGNRALAGKLLTAMKGWVAEQRAHPADDKAANLDELDKWIQERAQIAGQTAALTRAGTAASWR